MQLCRWALKRLTFDELSAALSSPELRGSRILIKGHTDSDGDEQYNFRLSLDRAAAVKEQLVSRGGIVPERLQVMGFGETLPLVANDSAANRQINRRVEIALATP